MPHERLRPGFSFTAERIEELRRVVPEAFADGRINWTALREALGEWTEEEGDGAEHFGLNWPGKREARRAAAIPSRGTLVPVPGEGVDEENTRNFFIEGENLEVLKILQKSYAGRVKLIYIDPPYNTGNDFVYEDDFTEPVELYLRRMGKLDDAGQSLTTNTRADGRFHSRWLSMMYPRVRLMRTLLAVDGFLVMSVDDGEVHHARMLLNEVFGEECFVAQLVWKARKFPDSRAVTGVSTDHEYLLVYSRSDEATLRGVARDETKFANPDNDPRGPWMSRSILGLATAAQRPNLHFPLVDPATGASYSPPANTGWRYSRERMNVLISEGRILFPSRREGRPREKKFRADLQSEFMAFPSLIDGVHTADGTAEIRELFGYDAFDFPKPSELLRRIVEQVSGADDIVCDFFAGSGSLAEAVARQNAADGGARSFILCQLPEPISEKSKNYEKGLYDLAAVGRKRLELAAKRFGRQNDVKRIALTFRALKLMPSTFRVWSDYDGDNVAKLADLFVQNELPLREGWIRENLIQEILLLEGFPLDAALESVPVKGNTVKRAIASNLSHTLVMCLDKRIQPELLRQLELRKHDAFVCLDGALSDEVKLRLADICQLKTI